LESAGAIVRKTKKVNKQNREEIKWQLERYSLQLVRRHRIPF
jgi:hypothetical protein